MQPSSPHTITLCHLPPTSLTLKHLKTRTPITPLNIQLRFAKELGLAHPTTPKTSGDASTGTLWGAEPTRRVDPIPGQLPLKAVPLRHTVQLGLTPENTRKHTSIRGFPVDMVVFPPLPPKHTFPKKAKKPSKTFSLRDFQKKCL